MARPDRDGGVKQLLDLIDKYWRQSMLLAFRAVLFGMFVTALIPSAREKLLASKAVFLPLIVAMSFVAFEVLLATLREASKTRDTGVVLENPQRLVAQLEEAFGRQRATLDVCSYSSETFHAVLGPLFRKIIDRELRMKQLHIRILVRDYRRPFVVPCGDDGNENPDYRAATVSRNIKFIDDFKADINQILDSGVETDIEFEIRMHPFEPLFKGVIINGTRGFWNLYPIMNARRSIRGKEAIIWDYYGERTRLVGLRNNGPTAERELFAAFSAWFSTVWDHFSTPVLEEHSDELQRQL